jgi:hypothetical protein
VPTGIGGSASTYNPNSRLNFTPTARSSGAGSAESVALARSRELDGLFQAIMQKAQREPQSYGELFARKGTLASLNALARLSQTAGSNYIQGAGDVLQAETSRYSTDRNFEAELGRQAMRARGDDLAFESNLGQQNVTREGDQLRAYIDEQGQKVTERVGNRQAAATLAAGQARAAAAVEAANVAYNTAQLKARSQNPTAMLQFAISRGITLDGKPASPEKLKAMQLRLQMATPVGSGQIIVNQ